MSDNVYDVPINEAAKILDKSDRQVRRYVKEKRLKVRPLRVDGHMKLMFNREEVMAFRDRFNREGVFGASEREVIVDAQLIGGDGDGVSRQTDEPVDDGIGISESGAVKYVIDALREQITNLQSENRDLHYQLEQRSGQVGFLQGKIEALQDEVKMLMPVPKPEEETPARKPWYRRVFRRN